MCSQTEFNIKQEVLAFATEYLGNPHLEQKRQETLKKTLHIVQENVHTLSIIFNNEEKYTLIETCCLLNKSISLISQKDQRTLIELVKGFDHLINKKILPCDKNHIHHSLDVLDSPEKPSDKLKLLAHWTSVNKVGYRREVSKVIIDFIKSRELCKIPLNFQNLSQKQLFEIIKLFALIHDEDAIIRGIHCFSFSQKQRFILAKIYVHANVEFIIQWMEVFNLSQEQRFILAKISTQLNSELIIQKLDSFKLSQKQQFIIAKIATREHGPKTFSHIKNLNFTQKQIFIIAKLSAQQNGGGTAHLITLLKNLSQIQRYVVARLCAEHNGSKTTELIHNFNLNPKQTKKVFLKCLQQNGFSLFHLPACNLKEEIIAPFERICQCFTPRGAPTISLVTEIETFIIQSSYSQEEKDELSALIDKVELLPAEAQEKGIAWLLSVLFCHHLLNQHQRKWIVHRRLWRKLLDLRAPEVRAALTISFVQHPPFKKARDLVNKELPLDSLLLKKFPLIVIPLVQFCQIGLPVNTFRETIKKLSLSIVDKNSRLKDVNLQMNLLKNMDLLLKKKEISSREKISIFTKILEEIPLQEGESKTRREFEKSLKNGFDAIGGLILMEDIPRIKKITEGVSLKELFLESFQANIPIKNIENFKQKYEEIFGSSRNPRALLIYAAGIKKLKDKQALNSLCTYIDRVLDGSFAEKRYSLEKNENPHLYLLFREDKKALKNWRKTYKYSLKECITHQMAPLVCPSLWIQEKILKDKHLAQDLSYFKAYVEEESSEKRKELMHDLGQEQHRLHNEGKDTTPLMIQKTLMRIVDIKDYKTQKNTLFAHLEELQKRIPAQNAFYTDIQDLYSLLQQEKKEEAFTALISDDPIDLLLIASDVPGSCLRIDGSPYFNKALLAYLLDGKILFAIIINQKGEIVARQQHCLLSDGQRKILFIGKVYPPKASREHIMALNHLAERKAEDLGIPLASMDKTIGRLYEKPLISFGSPAPYEYCDASMKIQKKGVYSINNVYLREKPQE